MAVMALAFFMSFVYANETAPEVVDGGTSAIYATE